MPNIEADCNGPHRETGRGRFDQVIITVSSFEVRSISPSVVDMPLVADRRVNAAEYAIFDSENYSGFLTA